MRPVVVSRGVDLASAPEAVWPFLADTDRTSRLIASAVAYRPIDAAAGTTAARFIGETRAGGFKLTYEELPFEWSEAKGLKVERRMRGGVIAGYTLAWSLAPSTVRPGGTRAEVSLELVPRFAVLRPFVWLEGRSFVARLGSLAEAIDAHVAGRAESPYGRPVSPPNARLLASGADALRAAGVRGDLTDRVVGHLRDAADADLVRVRPFELADAWGEARVEVLRAMLHAVPAGLLDLRWAIVCPSCRTASEQVAALDALGAEGHCQLCDISFELDLDRAVEATFVPHAGVRRVSDQMFCMGGPARTPHVVAQVNVDVGKARALDAPREPGRYRIFARGGAVASVEVEAGGAAEAKLSLGDQGLEPPHARVAPGGRVLVANTTLEPRHVKIEKLGYASAAATAATLSIVPEFRRLFSSALLKRGTPLKVSRACILFSDLTGSTALYTDVGDAAAFRLVDDHFDVMRRAIEAHDGVLVKTMGDAVMAAFTDARQCAAAAVTALAAFEEFRAAREHGARVSIKLGMFEGACYVVSANDRLDYFGQTVNVASRVQHLADAGQIVMARATYDSLGGELAAPDARGRRVRLVERLEARVKGIDAPLALVRLALANSANS